MNKDKLSKSKSDVKGTGRFFPSSDNCIDVAKDFSTDPWGRYPDDGEFNAESFRKQLLLPMFKRGLPFMVDLSGSNRYGSSFLEEAFGGLVRVEGITDRELDLMRVHHELLPSIADEVMFYIEEAKRQR
jgi:hypothetical protein